MQWTGSSAFSAVTDMFKAPKESSADWKAAKKAEPIELTAEQIEEFSGIFHQFDFDGEGSIETAELDRIMETLGHVPTEAELLFMIDVVDPQGTGEIELDEFLLLMQVLLQKGVGAIQFSDRE